MSKIFLKYQCKHNRQIALDKSLDCLNESKKELEKLYLSADTLDDKVLIKYFEFNDVKKAAKYFRDKGIKTKSGHTFTPAIVRKLINKGSGEVSESLLQLARNAFNENEQTAKMLSGSIFIF